MKKYYYKNEFAIDKKHLDQLRAAGWTWVKIAKYYGMSRQHLNQIRNKMGWKKK